MPSTPGPHHASVKRRSRIGQRALDPRKPDGQQIERVEATIALTRELIARSRATLDAIAGQLAGTADHDGAPGLSYLSNAEFEAE